MNVEDLITDRRQGRVVGHDHDRRLVLPAHVLQNLQDLLARLVIQGTGRLIAQEELGLLGERPGNCDPLLLPARQLGREFIDVVCQTNGR